VSDGRREESLTRQLVGGATDFQDKEAQNRAYSATSTKILHTELIFFFLSFQPSATLVVNIQLGADAVQMPKLHIR
jgi:hypothetical protein